jgi:uncharacterized membrane protein
MRVSASSVINSVPDVSATPRSWRGETPVTGAGGEVSIDSPVYSGILYAVPLRRAFFILAVVWSVLLPLTAFAASRPDASSMAYGFALTIYRVGHLICHQLPSRSFHLWGAALPVCARCTGIYVGAAATAVVLAARSGRREVTRELALARRVVILALVPTAATLVFEWTTGVTPANWIRALAGFPLGIAVAWAVGMVN